MILGIDTATSAIAVALGDEGRVLDHAARIDARGHSEHLAPLIADLLQRNGIAPADVTAIAVGTGPGPFTGLRVGMASAAAYGHALGIPVYGYFENLTPMDRVNLMIAQAVELVFVGPDDVAKYLETGEHTEVDYIQF